MVPPSTKRAKGVVRSANRRTGLSAADELQNEHGGHVVDRNDDGDHHGRQGGSSRAVDAGGQRDAKEYEVAAVDGLDNHAAPGIFPDQPGDGKEQNRLQDQNTGDGKYHQLWV